MAKHISKKTVFETPYFKVNDVEIELGSGKRKNYKIVEKNDSALIVPITSDNKVILIKEYFYAIDARQVSLPKGRIDPGYNALTTANKELQEEIGYKAATFEELGVFTISPGYYTQKTHVFIAQDLSASKLTGDEDEEIEVFPYPLDNFEELVDKGEITEARVIAALYLARRYLQKNKV